MQKYFLSSFYLYKIYKISINIVGALILSHYKCISYDPLEKTYL